MFGLNEVCNHYVYVSMNTKNSNYSLSKGQSNPLLDYDIIYDKDIENKILNFIK